MSSDSKRPDDLDPSSYSGDEHEAAPQPRKGFRLHDRREKNVAGLSGGIGTILGIVLISLINLAFTGSSTDQNEDEEKAVANAADTTSSSSLSDAQKESDQKQSKVENKTEKQTEEKQPKAPKPPTVLVTIELKDDFAQLASYTVTSDDAKAADAIPILVSATGVKHVQQVTNRENGSVVVILQRPGKPDQAIVKIVVSTKAVEVVFQKDPTDDHLASVQRALLATKDTIGVEVSDTWKGSGTRRSLAVK